MRRLLPLLCLLALPARAEDVGQCDDDFGECQETCTMQYGSKTDLSKKKKFTKCMSKCSRTQNDCRERSLETQRNGLDEGSLAKSTSSRQSEEEDLRHSDAPPPKKEAEDEDAPKAKKRSRDEEPAKETVREDEVVKSTRTRVSDPPPPKKEEPKKETAREEEPAPKKESRRDDPPPKRDEPAPKREEPPARAEEPKKSSGLDSDIRSEDEKPKKSSDEKSKKGDYPNDGKKKGRALDEWDPEAL